MTRMEDLLPWVQKAQRFGEPLKGHFPFFRTLSARWRRIARRGSRARCGWRGFGSLGPSPRSPGGPRAWPPSSKRPCLESRSAGLQGPPRKRGPLQAPPPNNASSETRARPPRCWNRRGLERASAPEACTCRSRSAERIEMLSSSKRVAGETGDRGVRRPSLEQDVGRPADTQPGRLRPGSTEPGRVRRRSHAGLPKTTALISELSWCHRDWPWRPRPSSDRFCQSCASKGVMAQIG